MRKTYYAPPNDVARRAGREDGLNGRQDHAAEYPSGKRGHGDYMLGYAEGEAERGQVTDTEIPRLGRRGSGDFHTAPSGGTGSRLDVGRLPDRRRVDQPGLTEGTK